MRIDNPPSLGSIVSDVAAVKAVTDLLPDAGALTSVPGLVWDEAAASHVTAGTVGERQERLDLLAAGGAGELGATQAGRLDAAISTRLGAITAIQRGTIAIANPSFSGTATITAAVVARAELRNLGTSNGSGSTLTRIALTNTTTVTATRELNTGDTTQAFEVTEYDA